MPAWLRRASSQRLLALACAAGFVDAASYLGLGNVFTANMTGNTVLLGVELARGHGSAALRSAVALAGFCLGVAIGAALILRSRPWPRLALPALAFEVAAIAALLVLWAVVGVAPIRYPLIVISACAMGAQSSAVRFSDVRGVNTTYMTSTLMSAVVRPVLRLRGMDDGSREGPSLPGAAWVIYGAGAVGGAFATRAWHVAAVAIPLAIVLAVLASTLEPEIGEIEEVLGRDDGDDEQAGAAGLGHSGA